MGKVKILFIPSPTTLINQKSKVTRTLLFWLVRETGLSPVATLADEQSTGLFGPSDKLPGAIFSLFQVPPPL